MIIISETHATLKDALSSDYYQDKNRLSRSIPIYLYQVFTVLSQFANKTTFTRTSNIIHYEWTFLNGLTF